MEFDLRKIITKGETYLIKTNDGYMSYTAIYLFNGERFILKLYHKNGELCGDFKKAMLPKEFKAFLKLVRKEDVEWLGVLEND